VHEPWPKSMKLDAVSPALFGRGCERRDPAPQRGSASPRRRRAATTGRPSTHV